MKRPPQSLPAGRRPFVLVNLAMSADGKIATANRAVHSFGSRRDQAHLYELRATADAVMCGARTVHADSTTLSPGAPRYRRQRVRAGLAEYPLRVVVSGSGRLDPAARLFQRKFSPVVVLTTRRASATKLRRLRAVADEVAVFGAKVLDWPRALAWLRRKWRVRRLLCEGGGETNAALFRLGLVDELHLTLCPLIFGGAAAPTLADGVGVARLAAARRLEPARARRVGDELFLVYRASTQRAKSQSRSARRLR